MFAENFAICVTIVLLSSCEISSIIAPSYIVPCPPFSDACITKTIQMVIPQYVKGIPRLGVNPLDPLVIKHADVLLNGGVKTEITNGIVTGLRKCFVVAARFDLDKDALDVELLCNLTMRGKYKAYGKILIVRLNGDGYAKIKATNVRIMARIFFQDEVRDGVIYFEAKDLFITHRYDGRVKSQISNLFNGNQKISDFILTFLNDNWRQVAEEIGEPIAKKIIEYVFEVIQTFFRAVPKNELFVEWEAK